MNHEHKGQTMMLTKHRTGSLLKIGQRYYVRIVVEGKAIQKRLSNDDGSPITTRREAEAAKEKFVAPYAVSTKAEALQALVGQLADAKAEAARVEDEQNPPLTITRAWTEFLASPKRPDTGPDTLAVYEGQFGQFQKWLNEKHPTAPALRDVTEEIAEEYAGHLNHGRLNPNTFNKHVRVLELVFRVLFKKARLTVNPWEGIQRKKLITVNRRELTLEELKRVCQGAPAGEMRTLFALGVYTGLRLRDCATLKWGEVDLQRGFIRRIPNKIARKENAKPVIIPIHSALRPMLEETPADKRTGFVLPDTAVEYTSGGAGKKRMINKIQNHFKAQGVQIHKEGTGPDEPEKDSEGEKKKEETKVAKRAVVEVGFHSLRHSFVSMCRASNVPLAVVEALVGHSNPAMTRHYTHTGDIAASNAVALLPGVIGEAKQEAPKKTPEAIVSEARAIVEKITGKNWKAQRESLLALLTPEQPAIPA
ncbi:MAG: hypothetical protein C5B50_24930 [Verrucomicrobia bacterium]|nr:MAG: hypothetical protein C5B50_24930 [Verrucomicrobiota bacterium]